MTHRQDDRLLHYRLLEKLGEGGMGVVWKALDESLGREVAIKMLPATVSADTERPARFEREARLLASLSHPNIATIHGLHDADGTRFIAMEYVRGEDLSVRLRRGSLPIDEALGGTVTKLIDRGAYPTWSPDGASIAFQSNRDGTWRIWRVPVAGGAPEQVTTDPAPTTYHFHPAWSPDGRFIAYGSHHAEAGRQLFVVPADGGEPIVVYDGTALAPAWSADGSRLVGGADRALWLLVPGGESRMLVDNGAFGTWSPDGQEVAYQRDAGSDHRELWIVPAEGGEPRLLVGGEVHLSHPQWHPTDPDRILVVIDHLDLGVARVSTGAVERITSLASSTVLVDYPSWSSDGETVYFSLARKRGDLYLIER